MPALPPHFLPRPAELDRLSRLLLADLHGPTAIGPSRQVAGMHGMGGIGKSVLAAAFARQTPTRRTMEHGCVWITAGQDAEPLEVLRQVVASFPEASAHAASWDTARAALPALLQDKSCLIVVDDVWSLQAVAPLRNALGPRCRLLIATRDLGIVRRLGAQEFQVDGFTDHDALSLLAEWSGQPRDALPPEAAEILGQCGNLPLAVAMIGAAVRGKPERWADQLRRLKHADLERIRQELPGYPYPDLAKSIEASLDALGHEVPVERMAKARFPELAVFPKGARIPDAAFERLWASCGLDAVDTHDVIDLLVDRALVRRDAQGVTLHDLLADYVRAKAARPERLHLRLLDAYRTVCQGDWPSGPDDGYFFQHLPFHLHGAGKAGVLRRLLLTYRWLHAKLAATSFASLVGDCALIEDDDALEWVRSALLVSAHALAKHPSELAGQLTGRLARVRQREVKRLLAEIGTVHPGVWLKPTTSALHAPRGSLIRTIDTGASVSGVASCGRRTVVSGSSDNRLLKRWDLGTAEEIDTVTGPRGWHAVVSAIGGWCVSHYWDTGEIAVWRPSGPGEPELLTGHWQGVLRVAHLGGHEMVSASKDRTLRVWNLETRQCLRVIEAHDFDVNDVISVGDRRVMSASTDIKVWNVDAGTLLQRVAVFPLLPVVERLFRLDDERVLCVHVDSTLRILDLRSGRLVRVLEGRGFDKQIVLAVLEGRWVVSESRDEYSPHDLTVWDLQHGQPVRTLKGHNLWVNAVATVGPRHLVSGSADGTLRYWDLDAPEVPAPARHKGWINSVVPLGDHAILSASFDATMHVRDSVTGDTLRTLSGPEEFMRAAVALDSAHVVSASYGHTLRIWRADTGHVSKTIEGHLPGLTAVAVMDPRRVVTASAGMDSRTALRLWDVDAGNMIREIRVMGIGALALFPDRLAICAVDAMGHNTLDLWDLAKGTLRRSFAGHSSKVRCVAVVNRHSFVSGSEDTTLRLWDRRTGQVTHVLAGHAGTVRAVAASAEGLIASASDDHTVRVWDSRTASPLATFTLDAAATAVAWIATSRRIAVGDASGRVHVFNVEGKITLPRGARGHGGRSGR